jgi:hypothetical protein
MMGMAKLKSKIASIRDAWPDILSALKAGHSLKYVCDRLNEDGVAVEYKMLRAYVSVLRREHAGRSAIPLGLKPRSAPFPDQVPVPTTSAPAISRSNPLATAMEYLNKVRGFQNFTGEPPDPDKIF